MPTSSNDHLSEVLFQVALVCGAGRIAAPAVEALSGELGIPHAGRSCIDGGASVLLAVRAPGDRAFDVCVRQPGSTPGVQHWRRTRMANGSTENWDTRLFLGAPHLASEEIRRVTDHCQIRDPFVSLHAKLGPNARLFLTSIQETRRQRRVWIGWHLDKHFTPRHALAACNLGEAWLLVGPTLESLLGRGLPARSRGWSFMAGFAGQSIAFRLGTTLWSRMPESAAKWSGFRGAVAALGGDSSFAEALYRLLLPDCAGAAFVRPTGCAIEFEVHSSGSISADFILRLQSPAAESNCASPDSDITTAA
jgi:hypothetical protein